MNMRDYSNLQQKHFFFAVLHFTVTVQFSMGITPSQKLDGSNLLHAVEQYSLLLSLHFLSTLLYYISVGHKHKIPIFFFLLINVSIY